MFASVLLARRERQNARGCVFVAGSLKTALRSVIPISSLFRRSHGLCGFARVLYLHTSFTGLPLGSTGISSVYDVHVYPENKSSIASFTEPFGCFSVNHKIRFFFHFPVARLRTGTLDAALSIVYNAITLATPIKIAESAFDTTPRWRYGTVRA